MKDLHWQELKDLITAHAVAYCDHSDAANNGSASRLNDAFFEEQTALGNVEKYVRKLVGEEVPVTNVCEECRKTMLDVIEKTVTTFTTNVIKSCRETASIGKGQMEFHLNKDWINNPFIMPAIFEKLGSGCGFKVEYVDSNKSTIRVCWL